MNKWHNLKCWAEPFQAVVAGRKKFEFRRDDRGFKVGDILELHEWDPIHNRPTPSEAIMTVSVTYILRDLFGMPPGFVVMSIQPWRWDDE